MMVKSSDPSEDLGTNAKKTWLYDEYYFGDHDQEDRRHGGGENHWTGAKSIEWYLGNFSRNTMHGMGEYRWRYLDTDGPFISYEGHLYCNRMHGYGTMSYADGKVFQGIYNSNIRWGPGIETHIFRRQNVGLWCGQQLVRLSWKPPTPNVAPDLCMTPVGREFVENFRIMLASSEKTIGDVNNAIELLKRLGADPRIAIENWKKLYPRHCTDLDSAVSHNEVFESRYFNKHIRSLEVVTVVHNDEEKNQEDNEDFDKTTYYAWNNNKLIIQMMKHCYQHEKQTNAPKMDLSKILSGPRKCFRPCGKHETNCRTLLMASYLGHMTSVTRLINSDYVYPDVCDVQGNNTVMYASCGDQPKAIQFLVAAGADVDSYNDSCCTPLAVALIRYLCVKNEIVTPTAMVQALVPPPLPPSAAALVERAEEWKISRDLSIPLTPTNLVKTPSKLSKIASTRKVRSSLILGQSKKKIEILKPNADDNDSDESINEEKKVYADINTEFIFRLEDLFTPPIGAPANTPYIFDVNDMLLEIEAIVDEPQKANDKNQKKVPNKKGFEEEKKPSKNLLWLPEKEEVLSLTSAEKEKVDRLARIGDTVAQLLADGANPTLVRCPQSALFIAVVSGSSFLVRNLVTYGVNVNEEYPQTFGYTPLDLAISRPFTVENLDLIRTLLECGASASQLLNKRIVESTPTVMDSSEKGPTLLHAVFARPVTTENEEEIRRQILQLLLKYNCDSASLFRRRSALDIALSKSIEILNIFIENPKTNLNAVINNSNQTILIKMFSMPFFKTIENEERFHILTNLLLYGADPLIPCQNGDEKYENLFQFMKKILSDMESTTTKPASPGVTKVDLKAKSPEKPKKEASKSPYKMIDDIDNYKEAVKLITECGRLLHIRWLQSKLVKDLIEIVYKFRHRQWNMIVKEHQHNKKATALWVTPQRCLEICDILSTTKRKVYADKRVLKHLLCIVYFYNINLQHFRRLHVTAEEKNLIDERMFRLLEEHNLMDTINAEVAFIKRSYVLPELADRADKKFKVCFECSLPMDEFTKIKCKSCQLVTFCDLECMKNNIQRSDRHLHPCSSYLKLKYFPDSETVSSETKIK